MSVYVDIDLDFLVKPIQRESINNVRLYKNELCLIDNVDDFIDKLKVRGLLLPKERKFFLNHKKSYTYWWIRRKTNNTLIHIDAHSDMYRNKNYDLTLLRDTDMGCDDYIWYAIRDGFISEVYWVIPDGSYDIYNEDFINRTIPRSMLIGYKHEEGMLKALIKVNTREGEREIEFKITHLDNLPSFNDVDIMTVATSPEFIPESADIEIERALTLIGAAEDEVLRIIKAHGDMPSGQTCEDYFIPTDDNAS